MTTRIIRSNGRWKDWLNEDEQAALRNLTERRREAAKEMYETGRGIKKFADLAKAREEQRTGFKLYALKTGKAA